MSDIDDIRNWQAHVSSPTMTDESAWITFCGDLADEIERLDKALDRAVVSLNTPNPTGIVYTRAWLEANR